MLRAGRLYSTYVLYIENNKTITHLHCVKCPSKRSEFGQII